MVRMLLSLCWSLFYSLFWVESVDSAILICCHVTICTCALLLFQHNAQMLLACNHIIHSIVDSSLPLPPPSSNLTKYLMKPCNAPTCGLSLAVWVVSLWASPVLGKVHDGMTIMCMTNSTIIQDQAFLSWQQATRHPWSRATCIYVQTFKCHDTETRNGEQIRNTDVATCNRREFRELKYLLAH